MKPFHYYVTPLLFVFLTAPSSPIFADLVYIVNRNIGSENVAVLDATTLAPITGSPFPTGGTTPFQIAINPAGTHVYITNEVSNNVSVLDAVTLAPIAGSPFLTGGTTPFGIAINPA